MKKIVAEFTEERLITPRGLSLGGVMHLWICTKDLYWHNIEYRK